MFVESLTKVDPTAPAALAACGTPGTISAARRGTAPRTRPPAVCCSCSRCWRRAAPPPRTPPSARGKRKGGEHVLEQRRQLAHRTALLRQGASTATVPKPFALKMFGHTCNFGSFDGWSLFRHAEFRPGRVPPRYLAALAVAIPRPPFKRVLLAALGQHQVPQLQLMARDGRQTAMLVCSHECRRWGRKETLYMLLLTNAKLATGPKHQSNNCQEVRE